MCFIHDPTEVVESARYKVDVMDLPQHEIETKLAEYWNWIGNMIMYLHHWRVDAQAASRGKKSLRVK